VLDRGVTELSGTHFGHGPIAIGDPDSADHGPSAWLSTDRDEEALDLLSIDRDRVNVGGAWAQWENRRIAA
jgi:hypothetical protein